MEGATATNNGFVPLVTVVGFHHARYVLLSLQNSGERVRGNEG